jgi:hypothetical protein
MKVDEYRIQCPNVYENMEYDTTSRLISRLCPGYVSYMLE